jgi:hypothetical protein
MGVASEKKRHFDFRFFTLGSFLKTKKDTRENKKKKGDKRRKSKNKHRLERLFSSRYRFPKVHVACTPTLCPLHPTYASLSITMHNLWVSSTSKYQS